MLLCDETLNVKRHCNSPRSHSTITRNTRWLLSAALFCILHAGALKVHAEDLNITTIAGLAGSAGSTDGTGNSARFDNPSGVAVDGAGNIYVADSSNSTIRKITPTGVVTTLAGDANSDTGATDGVGSTARFNGPMSVAADGTGNVYVADTINNTIRKITSAGVVSTLAGTPGVSGHVDGVGSSALFNQPQGVAVDQSGNVYVADTQNYTIRKIAVTGAVTTIAGTPGVFGYADGTGNAAVFSLTTGVAVDISGNVFVADQSNNVIRMVTPVGNVSTLAGTGDSGSLDGLGGAGHFLWSAGRCGG